MDDPFADFDLLPTKNTLKRTYSHRHQKLPSSPTMQSGLATPPPSSSPPTSPFKSSRPRIFSSTPSSIMRKSQDDQTRPSLPSLYAQRNKITLRSINTPSRQIPKYKARRKQVDTAPDKADKKKLVQMHFNLLPAHITCKLCGMSYTRTDPSDVSLHSEFHQSHLFGLPLPPSIPILKDGFVLLKGSRGGGGHASTGLGKLEATMMRKCSEVIDAELSASATPLTPSTHLIGLTSTTPTNSTSSSSGGTAKMTRRLVSFVIWHPQDTAFTVTPSGELNTATPMSIILGVSRMWTAQNARGRGLVRKLLDQMCEVSVVGYRVKKKEVGFTQLSGSGEVCVRKWVDDENGHVLVYHE